MKIIKYLRLGIIAFLTTFSAISCDDETGTLLPDDTLTAKYSYRLAVNPMFLSLADITISTAIEGKGSNTISLTDTIFLFEYETETFPTTIKAHVNYTWKTDLDTTLLDKVDLIMNSHYAVSSYNADGEILKSASKTGVSIYNKGVDAANLERIHEIHLRSFEVKNMTVNIVNENNTLNFYFKN